MSLRDSPWPCPQYWPCSQTWAAWQSLCPGHCWWCWCCCLPALSELLPDLMQGWWSSLGEDRDVLRLFTRFNSCFTDFFYFSALESIHLKGSWGIIIDLKRFKKVAKRLTKVGRKHKKVLLSSMACNTTQRDHAEIAALRWKWYLVGEECRQRWLAGTQWSGRQPSGPTAGPAL